MLFNLGMTADAAAAHNEVISSPSETQLSTPTRSFTTLPSRGLGTLPSKNKLPDISGANNEQRRSMPVRPVEHTFSDDEDKPPSALRSHLMGQQPAKRSSRTRISYQLAHPAANARHKRLKLRPKLLLQLQRVSHTSRPLPVLDILPSTLFMPRLSRKFPTILRGKKGLGPNDLIVTTSDLYEGRGVDPTDRSISSDEENGDHREVVATICQMLKEDALSKGKAEICLDSGPVWEATPLASGSYEFTANTDSGMMILRWVRRGAKKRRASAPPGSIQQEDSRRFTFSVIDPSTRRHPIIASMTRNQLEVYDRYSVPSGPGGPSSPTSAMSVISDASDVESPIDRPVIETDDNLRMLIIITSIWVAFREGWSPNFSYNDTAVTPKAVRSPTSKVGRVESETLPAEQDSYPEKQTPVEQRRRVATWSVLPSQQTPIPEHSMQYGSISKRSNSTGAAFIARSNRRWSATNSRPLRHSMLAGSREPEQATVPVPSPTPRISDSPPTKGSAEDTNGVSPHTTKPAGSRKATGRKSRPPEASRKKPSKNPEKPTLSKGKCRHRFSSLFDFILRKHGNHS